MEYSLSVWRSKRSEDYDNQTQKSRILTELQCLVHTWGLSLVGLTGLTLERINDGSVYNQSGMLWNLLLAMNIVGMWQLVVVIICVCFCVCVCMLLSALSSLFSLLWLNTLESWRVHRVLQVAKIPLELTCLGWAHRWDSHTPYVHGPCASLVCFVQYCSFGLCLCVVKIHLISFSMHCTHVGITWLFRQGWRPSTRYMEHCLDWCQSELQRQFPEYDNQQLPHLHFLSVVDIRPSDSKGEGNAHGTIKGIHHACDPLVLWWTKYWVECWPSGFQNTYKG